MQQLLRPTKEPNMNYVSIPFPAELYKLIVIRSGGKLDPGRLAVDQIEGFIEANRDNASFWTSEGLDAFADEDEPPVVADYGDPSRGLFWSPLTLRNGAELRMRYRQKYLYARIAHEQIGWEGQQYSSVSQWVRAVAGNTSRNAWHDVWIKQPGEEEFSYSDAARRDHSRNRG
jgi:hypothetical protein